MKKGQGNRNKRVPNKHNPNRKLSVQEQHLLTIGVSNIIETNGKSVIDDMAKQADTQDFGWVRCGNRLAEIVSACHKEAVRYLFDEDDPTCKTYQTYIPIHLMHAITRFAAKVNIVLDYDIVPNLPDECVSYADRYDLATAKETPEAKPAG